MKINKLEWDFESDRLQTVIKEIRRQLDEKRSLKEKFKKDTLETQRDLWEDLGSVSITNGLEQVVDFMQFINSMKIHKRSHEFTRKLEEKYERMLSSPYFGRIDFIEDKETGAEKCYIGVSNLISENYDFLIYDWRAPISSMFYDCEIGNGNYICPDGMVTGKITKKRQYKIENGKIEYMFDSNLNIDDEVLQEILSKGTDTKMKAIVTTIQREQNKVIRDDKYKNLIVQGPAGSGKTSVALHRIAYLLYKHRDKITAQNIVVFSPNNIFNDYISNVLPQLGEDNMCQTTFKEYMHSVLGDELIKEDYCDMMEYLLTNNKDSYYLIRVSSIRFKASMKFVYLLREYVSYLEEMNRDFEDIVIGGSLIISSKDLQELFYKDYVRLPLKRRLQKIGERILFLMESYDKNLIQHVADKIDRITKLDIVDIYKYFYENLEFFLSRLNLQYDDKVINEIKSYTLESLKNEKLNYEDQISILYLKGAIGDMPKTSEIKYVIIDEAQDYTPLQYEIFHQLFKNANKTILGDVHQSINPFMNVGDYNNITGIFEKDDSCIINLTKSYRSTMEITKFSRRILNNKVSGDYVERRGEKPRVIGFTDEELVIERLLEDIKKYKNSGYNSIGIITKTNAVAKKVCNFLKDTVDVNAILNDNDEYVNAIVVIPSYLAKGLEFDVVILYNAGEEEYSGDNDRLLLYTACTRALHILCIYYLGKISPLLKEIYYSDKII